MKTNIDTERIYTLNKASEICAKKIGVNRATVFNYFHRYNTDFREIFIKLSSNKKGNIKYLICDIERFQKLICDLLEKHYLWHSRKQINTDNEVSHV